MRVYSERPTQYGATVAVPGMGGLTNIELAPVWGSSEILSWRHERWLTSTLENGSIILRRFCSSSVS